MATPLRKDEAQFEDEPELTTADLAQGKKPANTTDIRGPQAVTSDRGTEERVTNQRSSDGTPLFPGDELENLRTRWKEIQTGFVDEPRKAVEEADGLVTGFSAGDARDGASL